MLARDAPAHLPEGEGLGASRPDSIIVGRIGPIPSMFVLRDLEGRDELLCSTGVSLFTGLGVSATAGFGIGALSTSGSRVFADCVITPTVKDGYDHVWHQYTIRVDGGRDRDAVARQLNEAGIGTGIFYPVPAHRQEYMRDIAGSVRLPVAEKLAEEVISLPVHPQLSQADLDAIVTEVNRL